MYQFPLIKLLILKLGCSIYGTVSTHIFFRSRKTFYIGNKKCSCLNFFTEKTETCFHCKEMSVPYILESDICL